MSQTRVTVSTETSGLVVIEPLVGPDSQIRIANGVAEVRPNVPFYLFVSNFGRSERRLPNNMVIATASKSPLLITEVPEPLAREVAQCLNIVVDAPVGGSKKATGPMMAKDLGNVMNCTVEDSALTSERTGNLRSRQDEIFGDFNEVHTGAADGTGKVQKEEEDASSENKWEDDVDLTGIEDASLRDVALEMLRGHA